MTVENGEVALTGVVDTREEKRAAEDVAERYSGVSDVHNQIRVKKHGLLNRLLGGGEESTKEAR